MRCALNRDEKLSPASAMEMESEARAMAVGARMDMNSASTIFQFVGPSLGSPVASASCERGVSPSATIM